MLQSHQNAYLFEVAMIQQKASVEAILAQKQQARMLREQAMARRAQRRSARGAQIRGVLAGLLLRLAAKLES